MGELGVVHRLRSVLTWRGGSACLSTVFFLAAFMVFFQVMCPDAGAGTVWSWGSNNGGQLGDGTMDNRLIPVQVVDPLDPSGWLDGVASIASGHRFSMAVKPDGALWVWGQNSYGQLGDGTLEDRSLPVRVIDNASASGYLEGVVDAAGGDYHALALKADGTVWAWGQNTNGQMGDGTMVDSVTPVQVVDSTDPSGHLTGVVSIAAGGKHGLALKSDGTVWAWGSNGRGQLGDNTGIDSPTAVQVADPADTSGYLTGVASIAVGGHHSLALKPDGTLWAWGENDHGELGDGTNTDSFYPIQVFDNVTAVEAGYDHTMTILPGGSVWAWGYNGVGQLGDGTIENRNVPGQVLDLADPTMYLSDIIGLSGGCRYSAALKADGTVRAWGQNGTGQLGDDTTEDRYYPVQVLDPLDATGYLTGVSAIPRRFSGGHHALALVSPVRIGSITMGTAEAGSKIYATATVLAVDRSGAPLSGISVYGHWEGLTVDTDVGKTKTDGTITLSSDRLKTPVGTFTFVVDSVEKEGYIFDPYQSELSGEIQYP